MNTSGKKKTKPRGGRREGAGRPPVIGAECSVTIRMTNADRAYVMDAGEGSLSAGIRRIVDEHRTNIGDRTT